MRREEEGRRKRRQKGRDREREGERVVEKGGGREVVWIAVSAVGLATAERRLASPFLLLILCFYWRSDVPNWRDR